MLELRFLGVPSVTLDGAPAVFTRRRSIPLLAYLVMTPRPHPRSALATLLAGDSSEDFARKVLANALADVRHAVGDYVVATHSSVTFDASRPHRLDVVEFQQRSEASSALEHSIGIAYQELLAGVFVPGAPDFEAWLYLQREELRSHYPELLSTQVTECSRLGDWKPGIRAARRLLAEEPWLEEAHRHLMLMLAQAGQRCAAIAQYHTCRRVLLDELGIEPLPETKAVFDRLRRAAA